MLGLLQAPDMAPFTIAGLVLFGLVILETVGLLLGTPVSHALSHLAGGHAGLHLHGPHGGHAAHGTAGQRLGLASALSWLNVGRVPLFAVLIALLATFSASGLLIGGLAHQFGLAPPQLLTVPAAVVIAAFVTRPVSRVVGRLVPQDESYALAPEDFIGCVAEITVGPARAGVVARGRLKDRFGNWHFPRIEPAEPGAELPEGARVLVIAEQDGVLRVVAADERLVSGDLKP